jgi:hypothetical protein
MTAPWPVQTPPPCRCPNCFQVLAGPGPIEKCPRCSTAVPVGWQRGGTTCIVLAGARYTGKSIFIGVMIKQLEQFAAQVGMDVAPATRSTRLMFEEHYARPLYARRGVLSATRPVASDDAYQRDPLAFTLTAPSGHTHHLVVRDVAGEDLEHLDDARAGALGFFREADFVFFLFDPLQVEAIRTKLRDFIPAQKVGAKPLDILNTVLDLTGHGTPRIGVILSKFDAVQALRQVQGAGEWGLIMRNPGAAFFRDRGPTALTDPHDGELLHEEVRSLLLKLDAATFVAAVERRAGGGRSGGHRFFAVSALGEAPDGEDLSKRGIAPFRCLDPLRWALAGTGILG